MRTQNTGQDAQPEIEQPGAAGTGEKPLVLVVEDNPDLNMALCEILESYDYRVQSARNGIDALSLMRQQPPDVILCDIMMPQMDGYDFLKQTRADKDLRTLPFIFLTARTSTADLRRALDIGIEDYLTKPVDEQDLVLAIRNALRRRKMMEEEMAAQLDALRNQIVATLQHEFRTPLTFVLGFAEYLQDITEDDVDVDELRTAIAGILEGGHRLQRLIESFLMLAEVQNRQMQPEDLEALNALALLQNIARDFDDDLQKAGLTIEIARRNVNASVIGAPELINEAVKRLIDNAIRYRRQDSRRVWLSVEQIMPTLVGLRVRDEGPGIPSSTVAKLLRPFEQGNRSDRTQPGAGLSLALITHIARMHGGRIEVQSEVDEGSTFTLWLPAASSVNVEGQ